jgi:LPXTG-motif cell wall-anchored protein
VQLFNQVVLGASTPFGAVYGSSVGQSYLVLSSPPISGSSSTVFTFASATPATGFGFTLGDIDAESVTISATTTGGVAVTAAELGYTDSFNYASGADVPTWNAGTSSLIGNVAETSGASGWFSPTVPLVTITFTSTTLSGSPDYRVWMAALIPVPVTTTTTTTIATTTTTPTTTTAPISINDTPSVSNLPATGSDFNFAYVAVGVLILGLITVVAKKRLHHSHP